jgi:hypothetical protein
MHSREELYRFLWNNRDHRGVVNMPQGDVAKEFGISYQRLSIVMKEFIEMGLVRKTRHQFVPAYPPDKIPWDGAYLDLRKRYVERGTQP